MAASTLRAQCEPVWGMGGNVPGANAPVHAQVHWDPDGNGPATSLVAVAGDFSVAGSVIANRVAAYDPLNGEWSALGPGPNDTVYALAALPATYTAATFAMLPLNLAASSRPIVGTNWNLNVTNVPASGVIGIDIFGVADPGILDLSLFGLGQGGCQLRSTLDALNAWFVAGNSHGYSFPIPNNPSLVNFHLFTQSAVLSAAGLTQTITSQGIDGKLGDL